MRRGVRLEYLTLSWNVVGIAALASDVPGHEETDIS